MFFNIKTILLLSFVVTSLAIDLNIKPNRKVKKGIPIKSSPIVERNSRDATYDIEENKDQNAENISKVPKEEAKEGSKEEPKEESKEEPKIVLKETEKIEREDEDDERPSSHSPREVEIPTSSTTALPPITHPTLPPMIPTLPTIPNRPIFPTQPTVPTNTIPHHWNYWESPNWGNWGRNVPTFTTNWPQVAQQWPSMGWPSVSQFPSYNPNGYNPGGFGVMPNSGVPPFSFLVPQNPWPGHGFQYPGASPSMPGYPAFQPGSMPGFQPEIVPSSGPTPGFQPREAPMPVPQPRPAPGADPNRPLGPMGPEFNNPDATIFDPKLMPGNSGRFPSKIMVK